MKKIVIIRCLVVLGIAILVMPGLAQACGDTINKGSGSIMLGTGGYGFRYRQIKSPDSTISSVGYQMGADRPKTADDTCEWCDNCQSWYR